MSCCLFGSAEFVSVIIGRAGRLGVFGSVREGIFGEDGVLGSWDLHNGPRQAMMNNKIAGILKNGFLSNIFTLGQFITRLNII